jgi:hypothetical protein
MEIVLRGFKTGDGGNVKGSLRNEGAVMLF